MMYILPFCKWPSSQTLYVYGLKICFTRNCKKINHFLKNESYSLPKYNDTDQSRAGGLDLDWFVCTIPQGPRRLTVEVDRGGWPWRLMVPGSGRHRVCWSSCRAQGCRTGITTFLSHHFSQARMAGKKGVKSLSWELHLANNLISTIWTLPGLWVFCLFLKPSKICS